MSGQTLSYFILPDLVSHCKYPLRVNPYRREQGRASGQWLLEGANHDDRKRATFLGLNAGDLAALCYPDADVTCFRVVADFLNYLFNLDDWTDEFDVDETITMEECCIGAMRDPIDFQTDKKAGILTKSFFSRFAQTAHPACGERFICSMQLFFRAVAQEASDRMNDRTPDLDSYIVCRRDNGGCKACFQLIEYAGGFGLPDEVVQHPLIQSLEEATNDFVAWSNDVYSYNVEQSRNDTHNIVAVVMKQKGLDLQEATDLVGDYCRDCIERFESDRQKLPSWDPEVDKMVAQYVDGLQNWIVGSLHWNFDTERYFGKHGLEVKKYRTIQLLPKKTQHD